MQPASPGMRPDLARRSLDLTSKLAARARAHFLHLDA
jgi:hypothetical protein